jgi:hypothetical protein
MKLSQKIRKEAKGIAGGLFRMNAKGADRYGFSVRKEGFRWEICYGEFLFMGETERRVEWIVDLKTGEIRKAIEEVENETNTF